MKSFKRIAALLILCCFLGGCQPSKEQPSAATAGSEPADTTAAALAVPNDYVSDGKEETFTYTDKGGEEHQTVYRIPKLNFTDSDAQAINAAVSEKYGADFEAAAQANGAPEYLSINYGAFTNDDIISLLITAEDRTHHFTYSAFNYNKKTNKQLDNAGLLAYLQRDYDQTFSDLQDALQDDYLSKYQYENFPDDYYYQLEMTAGDEAVRQSTLYLNENGELYAVCTERVSLGEGEFQVLISAT